MANTPLFDFAQTLKERINLVEHISQYTKVSRPSSGSKDYSAICCFHDDKNPSMNISTSGMFKCHGCGAKGSIIQFHMEQTGLSFKDAVFDLATKYAIENPLLNPARGRDNRSKDLSIIAERADYYHSSLYEEGGKDALSYLRSRGLTDETIKKFKIGFGKPTPASTSDHSRTGLYSEKKKWEFMAHRVTFPIRDDNGTIVAFGGRKLAIDTTDMPKYLNTSDTPYFSKGTLLFGLHEGRSVIARSRRAIVVEGYMDVAYLHQSGIENAVGVMGANFSAAHAALLFSRADEITICLDGDKAGFDGTMRAIMEAAPIIRDGKRMSIVVMPDGDPDEFVMKNGKAAFESLIDNAVPISKFLIKNAMRGKDLNSIEGRTAFMSEMIQAADGFKESPLFADELRRQTSMQCDMLAIGSIFKVNELEDESQLVEVIKRVNRMTAMLIEKFSGEVEESAAPQSKSYRPS